MTEWRLFPAGTVPDFTTPAFFAAHPWVPPEIQGGHAERTAMVAALIGDLVRTHPQLATLSDLGCGDGNLLGQLRDLPLRCWGYDAGTENQNRAHADGLDVRHADLLTDPLQYGDIVVASEVIEHLVDPHGFLRNLATETEFLVISSPSAETDEWHYIHHAWAWDMQGYADLVTEAGWDIIDHVDCDGGPNFHHGIERPQRFQAISARHA